MELHLGPRTEETVAIYFSRANTPQIRAALPQRACTLEEALSDYRQTQRPGAKSYGRTIWVQGQYVGDIWCYAIAPQDEPGAMVSYCVFDPTLWGRGIASRALALFLEEIIPRFSLQSVGAFTFASNAASIRVLTRCGFSLAERFVEDGVPSCYFVYHVPGRQRRGFKEERFIMDKDFFDELERRIPTGQVRTRFAPSPTGYMHIGNLRTALYTWLIARHSGGKFILRIEDTDQGRLVEGAVDVIYATMRQCGLDWDEGPDVGGSVGPYVQTQRRELYAKYARRLVELGGAYYCFCDRTESAEDSGNFEKTDDPCRSLSPQQALARVEAGEPYVIRQKIPRQGSTTFHDAVYGDITVENADLDDQILLKRDGLPTYNFANVVDDHLMGITHVVRGAEYLSSAPKYNLLYEAFGWSVPTYIHCASVMISDSATGAVRKMSKRLGDPSYQDLMGKGYLSQAVVNYVTLLGWAPHGELSEQEFFTMEELVAAFEVSGISKSPSAFDLEKLNYFNAHYLREMPPRDFFAAAEPYLRKAVKTPGIDLSLIAPLVQPRCDTLLDIAPQVDFFDALPEYSNDLYCHKKMKTDQANSLEALKAVLPVLESLPRWDFDSLHDALFGLAERLELKNGRILWPVRTAVSGKAVTPGGAVELCHILGREETLRRIRTGVEQLGG